MPLDQVLVIKQPLSKESVELPAANPLQNFLCGKKLWLLRILNIGKYIISDIDIGRWVSHLILKVVYLIG